MLNRCEVNSIVVQMLLSLQELWPIVNFTKGSRKNSEHTQLRWFDILNGVSTTDCECRLYKYVLWLSEHGHVQFIMMVL